MKKTSAVACVSMLLMSCNGIDEAGPLPTVAPPPTSKAPTTAASTTTSTTSTSTTTTSTTILEPIVSEVPPTDPERVDVQAVGADAFTGYQIGWQAYRDATTDPSNQELRDEVARYHVADSFEDAIGTLDSLVEQSLAEVPGDGTLSFTSLIGIEAVGGDQVASIVVCSVLGDPVINVSTREVVFDASEAFRNRVELVKRDGIWMTSSEVRLAKQAGTSCS